MRRRCAPGFEGDGGSADGLPVLCVWLCESVAAGHGEYPERVHRVGDWSGLELLGTEETEEKGWKPEPPSITHCYKLTIPVKEAYEKVIARS